MACMRALNDAFPYAFPLVFAAVWLLALRVASLMAGWDRLARRYRADGPFDGRLFRFQSAWFRWATHYGGCMTFGVSPAGLYMVPFLPFRPFHPALLIPWAAVTPAGPRGTFLRRYRLTFPGCPGVHVDVPQRTFDRMVDHLRETGGVPRTLDVPPE
jgi:hypothetical protein